MQHQMNIDIDAKNKLLTAIIPLTAIDAYIELTERWESMLGQDFPLKPNGAIMYEMANGWRFTNPQDVNMLMALSKCYSDDCL